MNSGRQRRVLFHRNYVQYSGGQQKVLDYFSHFLESKQWQPAIYWAPGSMPMAETPWSVYQSYRTQSFEPTQYDLLFLAGMDWLSYPDSPVASKPVINLIQHVRHGDSSSDVFPFLSRKALRICVSHEVKAAIDRTGKVNGTTVVIENGIDLGALAEAQLPEGRTNFYILGNKQPELAVRLAERLVEQGYSVTAHAELQPRVHVLNAMANADVVLALPHATEGFYLPALEAMALARLVVVPDCIGNRSFCRHRGNCLMPKLDVTALESAALQAIDILASSQSLTYERAARETVSRFTIERERKHFLTLLEGLDSRF